MDATLSSPKILLLARDLESGDQHALSNFWNDVAAQGTPLIESVPGDIAHVLVTFVWRADNDQDNVVVLSDLVGWHIPSNRLHRLQGSDVWFRTYRVRADARFSYVFSLNDGRLDPTFVPGKTQRVPNYRSDPFDRKLSPTSDHAADTTWSVSAVELPAAPPQLWLNANEEVPNGRVEQQRFFSPILQNEHDIWIYTPSDYSSNSTPYPLLILFDGWDHMHVVPTPTILDNLIAAQQLPPLVAILLGNASADPVERQRMLHCHPPFAAFLSIELLPWVREHYHVTADAHSVVVGGWSSGGLAALYAGMRHPELFGNILAQSAPLYWTPDNERPDGDSEPEWLARQFATIPRLPLRVYLEVGQFEAERGRWALSCPDTLVANRHLRDVLQAKDYPLFYNEYTGGHDYVCWQGTLADGLVYLFGNADRGAFREFLEHGGGGEPPREGDELPEG